VREILTIKTSTTAAAAAATTTTTMKTTLFKLVRYKKKDFLILIFCFFDEAFNNVQIMKVCSRHLASLFCR